MSIYMNLGRKDVSDIFALSSVADINAGSKRGGEQVYDKEGEIGLLTLYTTVQVRVPKNTRISYIKVNVHAISSPKVDFDEQTNTVSIKYSWTQITLSSYSIFAKGVHDDSYSSSQPIHVPLLGTGLLSEQEKLGYSSHAGPVRIGNFTRTIELLRRDVALDDNFPLQKRREHNNQVLLYKIINYLAQRISLAIQRGNAASILGTAPKAAALKTFSI
ncbi:hypothetical protein MSG28_009290 [Choristoneura fumiferana]|uniref:Uncharacterized protein n=1 Tax=Choristoneura fumiferana TaxID=7141 RepID=A0ACC0KXW6_CHOFU|nr:hypothetical protein MSG28_009290 [Choristoneura fumiferana]